MGRVRDGIHQPGHCGAVCEPGHHAHARHTVGGGWEIRENKDPVDILPSEMKDEMRQRTKAWEGVLK